MGMGFGYKFVCRGPCAKHLLQAVDASAATPPDNTKICNRPDRQPVIIFESAKSAQQTTKTMKRNLLTVVAAGAIALGGFVVVYAQPGPGGAGCAHGHAFGLGHLTEKLNLTSDQQTKVQPILDQAKPQIAAIHQEAMQKAKTVIDSTLSQ